MTSIDENIDLIKGIHPGIILDRELKERKLPKRRVANSIGVFPQLLGDITKGKRRINPFLSISLGNMLGIDESFFLLLQAYHDIEQEKKKLAFLNRPNFKILRPVLFWDTDIKLINWEKHKVSVIKRVFERGNEQEINEIISFYGNKEIENVLQQLKKSPGELNNKINKYLKIAHG